ncbi:MAG TPA: site-2 protease family protein [Thermodesulfovibrionales bacterium]|nr:site-2 protease family protein [Thermodesulfovibrionales bacterium]
MQKRIFLHLFLFILTFFSTVFAGALQAGVNIFEEPAKIYKGLPFSLTLMSILLAHELSHYIASKKHNVKATLPYFIPAPTLIGTFGAFIKMKSPVTTRKALLDIGVSGPIAGFIMSVAVSIIGLSFSRVVTIQETKEAISLGDSLLFSTLSRLMLDYQPGCQDILLHPVAFAGWIGFFVTSLNLLPVGQLDGGHIAYALFGEKHSYFSKVLIPIMFLLGLLLWEGWAIWAVLLLILGLKHPPVFYSEVPLDSKRKFIGWLGFLIFFITFTPVPFRFL